MAAGCGPGKHNAANGNNDSTAKGGSKATSQPRPGGGGNFCAVVRAQLNGLKAAFPKNFTAPDQLKTYGAYLKETNAKVLAAAPTEIRSAVETQTKVSNAAADSYLAGKAAPPPDVLKQLRSPEFLAAAKQLATYGKDRCGLNPSSFTG